MSKIDHCGNCTLKGDMKGCLAAPCQIRENWLVETIQEDLRQAEWLLTELSSTVRVDVQNHSYKKEIVDQITKRTIEKSGLLKRR
jgi:hypothetical protein